MRANGKFLAVSGEAGILPIQGGPIAQALPDYASVLAFRPDGCLVATGRRSSIVGIPGGETLIWKVKQRLR